MPTAKTKGSKAGQQNKGVEYSKPLDSIPTYYANNTNVTVSNFDVKLTFGRLSEVSDQGSVVDPQAIVFMSPQHAKAVAELLAKQLAIFEGKIAESQE